MPARINFKPKKDKIVESILYLAHKGLELSQYKLVKLFYLADREHLRRFGRPITFDYYVAMEHGPVASITYDIAKGNLVPGVDPATLPFTIRRLGNLRFVENPTREINRSLFSISDLMILDEIVKKYGNWSFMQLYNLTHLDFAYARAWNNRKTLADDMYFEDFIDEAADKEDRVSDLEFTAPAY